MPACICAGVLYLVAPRDAHGAHTARMARIRRAVGPSDPPCGEFFLRARPFARYNRNPTLIRGSKGHVQRASWAPRTFFTFLARAKNVKTPPRGRAKNVKLSASTKTSPFSAFFPCWRLGQNVGGRRGEKREKERGERHASALTCLLDTSPPPALCLHLTQYNGDKRKSDKSSKSIRSFIYLI